MGLPVLHEADGTIITLPHVEYSGLEPLTSTLPVSRSSQMS